jgi:dTDP-4-amino-4,6-dideoxygalactose transaminase
MGLIFMNERIYLASPHMSDEGYEMQYVQEAFDTNWIAPLGPNVNAFEKEIAAYVGSEVAAALSTGTSALHLALISLGVGEGDEVFCSSLTFSASANPIIYQNATPIFIDSEPESFNMSPVALKKAFKEHNPKAVIVVNLYGQSADMDKIKAICDSHHVPIIEDAAESLGATYNGKMSGTFGKFGIFSFNGNKIITTSGGGMLVSDNEEAIQKARFWATQSREDKRHYEHTELGFNYRMSNVSAGIGRGQLRVLEERIRQKKAIYDKYKEAFRGIKGISMSPVCDYGEPNYWLSVMTIDSGCEVKPIDVMVMLENDNIEARPVWKPMHLQPFYDKCAFYSHKECGMSVAEDIFNRGVCLPSDTKMTDKDMDRIICITRNLFRN